MAAKRADLALWLRFNEAQEFHALITHLDIDCNFRQQRHAIAACHHLQDGRQTRRAELGMVCIAVPAIN